MSAIKGFLSSYKGLKEKLGTFTAEIPNIYATLTRIAVDKYALDTVPRWMVEVGTGTLDAVGHSDNGVILQSTAHGLSEGQSLSFTSGANTGRFVQVVEVPDTDHIVIGSKLLNAPAADDYTIFEAVIPQASASGDLSVITAAITPIDFLDVGLLVPTGGSLIPRLTNNALQVVASLAARCRKLQFVQDVGIPMNLYSDAARTQLICHLPLTPDETVDVDIPAGTALFIGAAQDTDIDEPDSFIEINFIG